MVTDGRLAAEGEKIATDACPALPQRWSCGEVRCAWGLIDPVLSFIFAAGEDAIAFAVKKTSQVMNFATEEVQRIAQDKYGVKAEVKKLSGYEEQNFLLTTPEARRYILKISGSDTQRSVLLAQSEMMNFLFVRQAADRYPRVIENTEGEILTTIPREAGNYFCRMLTYIDGQFWYKKTERSDALYESLGRFLGEMDRSLQPFSHEGLHRRLAWDISHAHQAVADLHYISDAGKRRLAGYFLLQFDTEVAPLLSGLRHACIHNDANDYNVLVQGDLVTGIIDFGDAVYTALIHNLAISCTYTVLEEPEPLPKILHIVKGYHTAFPLEEAELDLLYYLIAARLCISVTTSARHAAGDSDNEHHFLSDAAAWQLLEKWIRINPFKAADLLRRACGFAGSLPSPDEHADLLARRQQVIGRNLSISYQQPLKIIKGALQYLYDDQGNTFVDCVNNVSHVGHCHPVVVRAMQKQLATLNTNTRYLHDGIVDYAEALTATLPPALKVCYFVNSGSEANDLAIRMARLFTQRQDVIVLDHAYHGTSTLAMEMSPYKFESKGGTGQKPYIHKAISPDLYRGAYRYGDSEAGRKYAQDVGQLLGDLQRQDTPAAAFICETLLGVGGQIPLPDGYLASVYESVRRHGGVCIADEVQVGFGRVGEAFWGFELQGVVPDIVVMGKPMGNGHPLAAVVVTEEIAAAFNNGLEYFNTFGGNPVSMAAGRAVLEVIQMENMQIHALETGKYLVTLLRGLMDRCECIGDVRGYGLFIGVELVKSRASQAPATPETNKIVEQMKERGFLLSTDGPLHNVLKIKPPMVFSRQNAEELVSHLGPLLENLDTGNNS